MLKRSPKRYKNESSKNFKLILLLISTIALAIAAGCIFQKPEILKANPEIDITPLGGFYGKSEGMFTVLNGSIPEVKESLKDIVINKASKQSTFSADDELNFIVFRGVFYTGGYGINIDRVERQGNSFTIYATYIDAEGGGDLPVVTQPVAIIPIGRLAEGNYKAKLKVTKVMDEYIEERKVIERKVIESEKELGIFNFKVINNLIPTLTESKGI